MKFPKPLTVKEVAALIGAQIIGNTELLLTGINEVHKVEVGDVTFSDLLKYFDKSLQSAASAIILNEPAECPPGKAILLHKDPFQAYDSLVKYFRPFQPMTTMISDSAEIDSSAIIEPGVIIGHHAKIGKDSYIQAGAYIGAYSYIGERSVIQAKAIIGSDAFYYKRYPENFQKWTTGGRVIIGDEVEIGAGCTVNRCVSGDTIIGNGTKFDSLIHIGHGAEIGNNCLFAAQVGVGGNTIIEDNVVLYGQVGIAQNLIIGKGAVVLAKSGVSKNLEGGKSYFGYPASEVKEKYKELAALRSLPDFFKEKLNNHHPVKDLL